MDADKKGKLVIFSAPSGSGKTTLAKHVLASINNISFSISACSRKARIGEIDGLDYYFLPIKEFKKKVFNNEFIEWEEVYEDHFYGTLASEVERIRNNGNHVLFDVDVVGGVNIKKKYGKEALAIFVKPPSVDVLINRLANRSTDSSEAIKTRIKKAEYELSFEDQFDVTIINDNLESAKSQTLKIVSDFINS